MELFNIKALLKKKTKRGILLALLCLTLLFGVKAQNHLLLSEVTLQPTSAEFIEIFNPTNSAISLDDYYLADNQNYPYLPLGGLPVLDFGDFIIRFPQGAAIDSNESIVIAPNGSNFEAYFGQKPDFEIYGTDTNTTDMVIISENTAGLSNVGEGIALFHWNGVDAVVKDVDLMNVGVPTASSRIVDKTLITGYMPDAYTIPLQDQTLPLGSGLSTKRIFLEGPNEIHIGGNGITGDDETSENIHITWDDVYSTPTPGSTTLTVSGIASFSGSDHSLKVYPNPASSAVNLIVGTKAANYTIKVKNSRGAVVKTIESGNIIDGLISIDMSTCKSGIYFFVLYSDGDTSIQKVMLLPIVEN